MQILTVEKADLFNKTENIYVGGDVHFSYYHSWDEQVAENYIQWMKEVLAQEVRATEGTKGYIFLGDLCESALNSGTVFNLMNKWLDTLLYIFDWVVLIPGNHDYKEVRGKKDLTFKTFKSNPNVYIAERPLETLEIGGKTCRFFPHIEDRTGKAEEHYLKILKEQGPLEEVPFGFGHIALEGTLMEKIPTVPSKLLGTRKNFFGHIHSRVTKDCTGSIWATNPKEGKVNNRAIFKINMKTEKVQEIILPVFINYREIDFPDDIKRQDNKYEISVWIVKGNISKAFAEQHYPNVYQVKSTLFAPTSKSNSSVSNTKSFEEFKRKPLDQAFEEMLVEQKIELSAQEKKFCIDLLKGSIHPEKADTINSQLEELKLETKQDKIEKEKEEAPSSSPSKGRRRLLIS